MDENSVLISNQLNMVLNEINRCQTDIAESVEKESERIMSRLRVLELLMLLNVVLQIAVAVIGLMGSMGGHANAASAAVAHSQGAMVINTGG